MKEIKFREWDSHLEVMANDIHHLDTLNEYISRDRHIVMQFTGYKMFSDDVYFDDLVSNNFKTEKEVIRQIIIHEGTIMMKKVKGKSSLPKNISLHEWHELNFRVVGNIHQNPELLK